MGLESPSVTQTHGLWLFRWGSSSPASKSFLAFSPRSPELTKLDLPEEKSGFLGVCDMNKLPSLRTIFRQMKGTGNYLAYPPTHRHIHTRPNPAWLVLNCLHISGKRDLGQGRLPPISGHLSLSWLYQHLTAQ